VSAPEADAYAYFDTSAFVKRYVMENGSRTVRRLLRSHRVVSSVLLGIEVRSAVRRRRDERAITPRAYTRLMRRIATDEQAWSQVPVSDAVLAIARSTVVSHPVRTLDAIHVASAETLARSELRLPFVTADARQAAAARAAGLDVINVGRTR
jgi:predicted nucleic acid-binding protein